MQERMDLFDIDKAKVFLHSTCRSRYTYNTLLRKDLYSFVISLPSYFVFVPSNYVLNIMNCNENQF